MPKFDLCMEAGGRRGGGGGLIRDVCGRRYCCGILHMLVIRNFGEKR